jgi:hypothetical protein
VSLPESYNPPSDYRFVFAFQHCWYVVVVLLASTMKPLRRTNITDIGHRFSDALGMDYSELVASEILKFLPVNERLRASRIDARWHSAGRFLGVWAHDMPLAAGTWDVKWMLPSPRMALNMVACSTVEPLCVAVHRLRSLSLPTSSSAMDAALSGIASLHFFPHPPKGFVSSTELRRAKKRFLMQRYFPTLLAVLLCADIPQVLHIRKSRGDSAEDEAPIGLWDLCFTLLSAPDLFGDDFVGDVEVLGAILTGFHYFHTSADAIGLLIEKAGVFDAPIWYFMTCLSSLSATTKREELSCYYLRQLFVEVTNTVAILFDACRKASSLCDSDVFASTMLLKRLAALHNQVDEASLLLVGN